MKNSSTLYSVHCKIYKYTKNYHLVTAQFNALYRPFSECEATKQSTITFSKVPESWLVIDTKLRSESYTHKVPVFKILFIISGGHEGNSQKEIRLLGGTVNCCDKQIISESSNASPKMLHKCLLEYHVKCLQFPSRLSKLWAFFSSFFSSFGGDRNSWEADFAA